MYQIDGPDAVSVKPAKKPAENPPGWFDGGDAENGKKATMVTRDFLNTVQAELKNAIEGAGIALDRTKDDQLFAAIKALVNVVIAATPKIQPIPVGSVTAYMGSTAPPGWLACDGSTFSASTYPQLYALLGANRTPDLRGYFLRGYKANITAPIGGTQVDMGRAASGRFIADDTTLGIGQGAGKNVNPEGVFEIGESYPGFDITSGFNSTASGGWLNFSVENAWGPEHTGDEFRPQNMSCLYCIKHD